MRRLLRLTLTSLAVLSACTPPDTALRVTVEVRDQAMQRVRADCLKLTVSNESQELKSLVIPVPMDKTAVFGIRRGADLPKSIRVQVSGYLGTCTDEANLKLNAQANAVTAEFPERGVAEVSLVLEPPGPALDADRDGFVGAMRGGVDCRDDDNTMYPGALQVCANTSDTDCDGLGGCDDDQCSTSPVCANPPDRVSITSSISTMLRHECVGPFLVQLRNASGPRRAVRDTPVSFTTEAGITVHAVSNCAGDPLATYTIPYDTDSFEIYVKADDKAFGLKRVTAAAAQVASPGVADIQVRPQAVSTIAFTSPPRTVRAGECSTEQVTLEFRDAQGRRTDVESPTVVTLASAPGDIDPTIFYADAACATEAAMVQLQPGQGAVAVHVRAKRAGMVTLAARPGIVAEVTQALTVQPGAASKLAFTNAPFALNTTQNCSVGEFTIQLQDAFDNPVTAAADVPLTVTVSGLMNVSFFETATNCAGAPPQQFTIRTGSDRVVLKARGQLASATPGEVRAEVSNGAAITAATQPLSVSAGVASKFTLSGGPESPAASTCSAMPFRINLFDSSDNPASSLSNITFTLSTSPASTDPSFGFFTGAGCQAPLAGNQLTIPSGQASGTFYFRGNRAVTNFEVRASSSLTQPSSWPSGNSIRPGPPGKIVFIAPLAQTAQAGTCSPSPYVANVLDLFDNVTSFTSAQTVSVTPTPPGPRVGTGGMCGDQSVTLAPNATQVSFNAGHQVTGTYSLVATVGGFSTAPGVSLTVTPGPSSIVVDTPASGTANVVAGNCQQVTLVRRDAFGNNAPTAGNTAVTLATPANTSWQFFASNNCTGTPVTTLAMNSTHTLTFSVSPRTAGVHTVTANVGTQQATLTFNVAPGAPTLVFETPNTMTGTAAATQTAGGCTQVTVARKDAFNNDVPLGGSGGSVTFTLAPGTTVHSGTPCTTGNQLGASGTGPLTLGATDARATFYVSATRSSPTGGSAMQNVVATIAPQSATLALTVNPGAPNLAIVTPVGGTTTVAAGACIPVSVERRDAFNNLVPVSGAVNLTVSPMTNLTLFGSSDCTGTSGPNVSVTAGASTRSFSLRSTVAGQYSLTVSLDGQSRPLTAQVNPGPLNNFQFTGLPTSGVTAGTCIGPLTVRRRDEFNNELTGGAVTVTLSGANYTFSTTSDCAGAQPTLGVAIADGQAGSANFWARSTVSGPQQLTATLGAVATNATITINPGASILGITVPTGGTATVTANTCVTVTVERRDSFSNPVPLPTAGSLTVSAGVNLFNSASCGGSAVASVPVSQGASSSTFSVRTTTANPSLALTVTLAAQTAPLTLTINPGPTSQLVIEGLPSTLTAGTCTTTAITVRRQDQWGNNVTAEPNLSVSLSSGRFMFSSQASCASPGAGAMVTIASGSSVSTEPVYATATVAGAGTVTATAGAVTGAANCTVNPAAPSKFFILGTGGTATAGLCSGGIQVEARDPYDNPVTPSSPIPVTLGATPGPLTFFPTGNCTGTLPLQLTSAQRIGTFSFIATNAPSTELVEASGSLTASTQSWTVNVGTPTRLSWKTDPPTSVARFDCVAAGVIETLDSSGNVAPNAGAVTVTPSATAAGAVTFYSDAACTTPATTFGIPSGQSETPPLYMVASGSGSTTLSATSSPALTAAPNRSVSITGAQGTLTVTASSPDLEAGGCVTLTVTRNVGGSPSTLGNSAVDVSLPGGTTAVTLYPSTDCTGTGALTLARTFAHGASTTTVSARGRSAPQAAQPLDVVVTAADPRGGYSSGSTTLKAYPLVRRGTCHVTAGNASATCAVEPPIPGDAINRSFLVFTSTGSPDTSSPPGITADEQAVSCHLDATSGVAVVCTRANTGGNSSNQLSVQYQVVSWGRDFAGGGMSVQHFPAVATSAMTTNQAISAVNTMNTFVLVSSRHSGENDTDAFPVVRLTSSTNVEILTTSSAAHTVSLQVVSFAGASVSSTSAVNQVGQPTVSLTTPSTPTATTFALAMAQVGDGSAANLMCKRRFRVAVPSATSVVLRRGANASGNTCAGDVVTLANVQRVSIPTAAVTLPGNVTITGTNTSASSNSFTAVTPHRSIVFFGMQGPGGQTAGEGAFSGTGNDDDDTGPFHATAELNGAGTQVTVTRAAPAANADSVFTPFVVQFDP